MTEADPLILSHGATIRQIWSLLAEARAIAKAGPTLAQTRTQLRRIRHLRGKLQILQDTELAAQTYSEHAIKDWFAPVHRSLRSAEAHFASLLTQAVVPPPVDAHETRVQKRA